MVSRERIFAKDCNFRPKQPCKTLRVFEVRKSWYSLFNRNDRYHSRTKQFYKSLLPRTEIFIIEYILVETMTLLRARGYSDLAIQFRRSLSSSNIFTLHYSTPELEKATFEIFSQYTDKEWSYADCALLATARFLNTSLVFSFDHHIDQMGLQRIPK